MRPIPSDSEAIEAMTLLIGPLTGSGTFDVSTDERAATVLLDYGTAKVTGKPPLPMASKMDFHASLKNAVATSSLSGVNWAQLIAILVQLLAGLSKGT